MCIFYKLHYVIVELSCHTSSRHSVVVWFGSSLMWMCACLRACVGAGIDVNAWTRTCDRCIYILISLCFHLLIFVMWMFMCVSRSRYFDNFICLPWLYVFSLAIVYVSDTKFTLTVFDDCYKCNVFVHLGFHSQMSRQYAMNICLFVCCCISFVRLIFFDMGPSKTIVAVGIEWTDQLND